MGEKTTEWRSETLFRELTKGTPIARQHLHSKLLDCLRESIVIGELKPNTKIPEKELCERFGVSRTPLREALKVLAHEGLIVLTHNRGATVSPLTIEELEETFPIYCCLESLAGKLACKRMTNAEMNNIRALHNEMLRYYEQGALKRHFEINEHIHECIQVASHNQILLQLLRTLSTRIRRARHYASCFEERLAVAIEEHKAMMEAIEARNCEKLSRLLHEHMDNTFNSIKHTIAERIPLTKHNKEAFKTEHMI
jgi:DNA-binding GntR family transcriptional regulator